MLSSYSDGRGVRKGLGEGGKVVVEVPEGPLVVLEHFKGVQGRRPHQCRVGPPGLGQGHGGVSPDLAVPGQFGVEGE